MKNYLILCALAGLSVANKLPNMFFVMASILQAFSFPKLNLKRFVNFAFSGTIVSIFLFVAGTWQIRNQYASLWEWIVKLATHSGIHGRGETSFNLATYLSSLNNLYLLETVPFFIILAITVLWFFYKNRENKYKRRSVNILLTSLLFGILIFGKFPLSHYHQFHYIGILFIGSYLCSKLPKGIYWVVITIFLVNSVNTIDNYWKINNKEANYAISLEKFVENNPPKVATVWEWGRSLDYSLIHIRDWIGIRYSVYLSQERPNLLSLTTDMNKIVLANGEQKAVFETCWDILYIQGSELPRFINKYPKQKLVAKSIPESKDMWVVSSDHCINK